MSNPSKDHTSIRVHAPPGGQSSNIFGQSEFEQSAANKKKQSESNIFGSAKDNAEPAPAKQTRNAGNNIFGTDPEDNNTKASTLAGQYKQTQMKSNIFGTDEPTSVRHVSDKNKSNIFGIGDDQNKRQGGGVRRVGYNPINGEAYSKNTESEKQPESTVKAPVEENANAQAAPTNSAENDNAQVTPANSTENGNTQAVPTNNTANGNSQAAPTNTNTENGNAEKPVDKADNAQKNVHTSVRVFHPPGGKSNGPLW